MFEVICILKRAQKKRIKILTGSQLLSSLSIMRPTFVVGLGLALEEQSGTLEASFEVGEKIVRFGGERSARFGEGL